MVLADRLPRPIPGRSNNSPYRATSTRYGAAGYLPYQPSSSSVRPGDKKIARTGSALAVRFEQFRRTA
jgi:hypothetical protein